STDGMCASPSPNSMKMSIADQDIEGGIYYWKSIVTANGVGGNIWRKDFGNTNPEEEISPTGVNNFTCLGCHALSRDGTRMALNGDDDDSDDEYNDVTMGDVDVSKKKFINPTGYASGHLPGFATFSADCKYMLSSNGKGGTTNEVGGGGSNSPSANVLWLWNASDGSA